MPFDRELDVKGLNCPLPILRTKKALSEMSSGQLLRVLATDPGAVKDFQAFAKQTGNERFVYDAYRRRIMIYSDVVMEKAEDIEPAEGKGIRVQLEHNMARQKKAKHKHSDQNIYIVGPSRRQEVTASFGHKFVEFVRQAGTSLVPGEDECTFFHDATDTGLDG